MSKTIKDRFKRQLGIIDPDDLDKEFLLVGCGSVGTVAGITLVKMGARFVRLIDGDRVEDHNIPNQFFPGDAADKLKVDSLKEEMERYAPQSIVVDTIPEMFSPANSKAALNGEFNAEIVIVSVDSLKARKMIYEEVKKSDAQWLIDGRTAKTVARVYTIDLTNEDDCALYEASLEAKPSEIPCSERSVMFNVGVVGGYIGAQVRNVIVHPEYYNREILIFLDPVMVITRGDL